MIKKNDNPEYMNAESGNYIQFWKRFVEKKEDKSIVRKIKIAQLREQIKKILSE